jgi:dTDP-4-amino-4,6-dideoxygalactose transaminase
MKIPFNKPFLTGLETTYIEQSVKIGKISGDGPFTKKCHEYMESRYGFKKVLLTTSCTDALEMAAILANISEGDEVIAPSYTFVSTVNAFVLRGAKIVFCDSKENHPNIDEDKIEDLITSKTKVIVPVHYAGFACNMDKIMEIASRYNLIVVEDAAQAIDNYYIGNNHEPRVLGSIGHLATFSFHETKNIISGEGGMLVINDESFISRAEIIREKGTNRSAFFKGEVDKYNWVDIGSSFLPSDIIAAFLYAQLENLDLIQDKRKRVWNFYNSKLSKFKDKNYFKLPEIPLYSTNNGHMYYLILNDSETRDQLIIYLKNNHIGAVFHYLSLNKSPYFNGAHSLENSDKFSDTLLRLPFYYEIELNEVDFVCDKIIQFFTEKSL